MEYDHLGLPPPPPPPPPGQDYYGDPLIQFDVGDQGDHIRHTHPQQQKQKGNKNNNQFNSNNANGFNSSNNNGSTKKAEPVEIQYRGFMLKKAEPLAGEESSWARVIQSPLPFSNAELAEESKKVRNETKTDTMTAFSNLSSEQTGVVERIVAKLQVDEKVKNAVWVLHSVKKHKEVKQISWRTAVKRTSKIQIILKRQHKNAIKPGQKPLSSSQRTYQSGEVIDLSDPAPKKKVDHDQYQNSNQTNNQGSNKTGNKARNNSNQNRNNQPQHFQGPQHNDQQWPDPFGPPNDHFLQEPMMSGGLFDGLGHGPPPMNMMQDHYPPNDPHQQQPMFPAQPPPPPPPAPQPPPGAIPVGEWDRQQGHMHDHHQRQASHSRPPTLRHDPFEGNPFRPDDNVYNPDGYGLPPDMHDANFPHAQPRARSFTPGPRYSSRDPSRDREPYDQDRNLDQLERRQSRQDKANRRNSKQLQRKFDTLDDKLEEVISKVDEWKLHHHEDTHRYHSRGRRHHRDGSSSSGSSSSYLADNIWTAPASGGSFTPPETPPLEPVYLDGGGSLSRRKTLSSRPYRSSRGARDAQMILEPAGGYPPRRRNSHIVTGGGGGRSTSRPRLQHATTWHSDYPNYPVAVVERERERAPAVRMIQQYPEAAFVEYGGRGRAKYDGGGGGRRGSFVRRDSAYGRERDWEDQGPRGERLVYVDRGRRSSSYIN